MSSRSDAWRCAALVVFVLAPLVTSAQPATTPWGDPDLQGIWTNFDLGEGYSLEAPVPFGDRPARLLGGTGTYIPSSEPLPEGSSDAPIFVIPDHLFETATDTGKVRPSLISEPPDGRLPPLTEAGDRRIDSICPKAFESYVYLDPWVRCITSIRGHAHSEQLTVTERFTPVGVDGLDYNVTVNDPQTWVTPWKVAIGLTRFDEYAMYEYACHEGNKSAMMGILGGARADEWSR